MAKSLDGFVRFYALNCATWNKITDSKKKNAIEIEACNPKKAHILPLSVAYMPPVPRVNKLGVW